MTFRNPILGAGGSTLLRPAIQSPNYAAGASGWSVKRDGSAEFNNLALRGVYNGTNYVINSNGLFFYSAAPALGNMTGSWARADGTDAYGNAYLAGITIYSSLGQVQLAGADGSVALTAAGGNKIFIEDGAIAWAWTGSASNAQLIIDTARRGALQLSSGKAGANDKSGMLSLTTSNGVPTAGSQDTYPHASTSDYNGAVIAHHYVTGAMVKTTDLAGTTGATWQAASGLGTGWAAGPSAGTVQALQYRLDAEDNLVLEGAVHTTSTTPAATIFTLPTAYRPKVTRRSPGVSNSGGTATARYVEVNSTGAVSINANLTTSSTDVYFSVTVPLGNLA